MPLETVYRTCPTCEASCGLKLEVDRDKGEVISVKGDPDDKRSAGYVCAKSQAFVHIHRDPERLRRPVRRTAAGAWEEISWDEALEEVGNRLRGIREEYGKDSIVFYYGNPNGHNVHTQLYTRLFITMMNSERFFSAGSVDQQPRNLACEIMYGNPWMFQVPDLARTDFLVCMGGNPLVSQGSILGVPDAKGRFEALQERGGKIIVLDPRRSETATAADEHLFIRPGTDAFLLLAWVHELFARDKVTLEIAARINGMTASELNTTMLDGLLAVVATGAENSAELAAQLRTQSAHLTDGERLLDIMLRVGPYGLNLAQLKSHPHGLELGELHSMLPAALRTDNQHLHLLHPLLKQDLKRLHTALERKPPELVWL